MKPSRDDPSTGAKQRDVAPRKPQAADAHAHDTPPTDMQEADAGTPASGAANRGSPAAPVMKQFAKTPSEGGGRP